MASPRPGDKPVEEDRKLFVGGLPFKATDRDLRAAFERFGRITDARVVMERETGRSRGYGFVVFETRDDGRDAIDAMDGKELDGRVIRVDFAGLPPVHLRKPLSEGGEKGRSYDRKEGSRQESPRHREIDRPRESYPAARSSHSEVDRRYEGGSRHYDDGYSASSRSREPPRDLEPRRAPAPAYEDRRSAYERAPYERAPYERAPYERAPHERVPHERAGYERAGYDDRRGYAPADDYARRPPPPPVERYADHRSSSYAAPPPPPAEDLKWREDSARIRAPPPASRHGGRY